MTETLLPLSQTRLSEGEGPARIAFRELLEQVEIDLAPAGGGHWSEEDWREILERVDQDFSSRLTSNATPEQIRSEWAQVATTFHREKNWNYRPTSKKREKPLTEGQKRFKELFPYIWTFVQAAMVTKFAVYYFGINNADDPSTFNLVGLLFFLALSFCSLVFFAWRMHRKEKREEAAKERKS